MGNRLLELIKSILNPNEEELTQLKRAVEKFPVRTNRMADAIDRELNRPPRIALIGKSGVGKSSTINALFNPHPLLEVGPVTPTTYEPFEVIVPLGGRRGHLVVIDGPGLGASKSITRQILPMYADLIPTCDLILWVIKADDKALEADQDFLENLLTDGLKKRLVIGINQIDKIPPGNWNIEYFLPSPEQEINIMEKEEYVHEVLLEIGIKPKNIVSYSAFYSYRLTTLFTTMLNACPKNRAWVLKHRAEITSYDPPVVRGKKMFGKTKSRRYV